MEFDANQVDGLSRVTLRGRLDSKGVDQIETRFIASVVPVGRNALVDLSGVEFMSSLGIRMLLSTARALGQRKARLVLYGAQPMVQESFDQMSLGSIVPIVADESQALALIEQ